MLLIQKLVASSQDITQLSFWISITKIHDSEFFLQLYVQVKSLAIQKLDTFGDHVKNPERDIPLKCFDV